MDLTESFDRNAKTGKKRKIEESSSQDGDDRKARRTLSLTSSCTACRSDELIDLVEGQIKGINISNIRKLWYNRDCLLCELLREIMQRSYDVTKIEEAMEDSRVSCRLSVRPANTIYLRRSGIGVFNQIRVDLTQWKTGKDYSFLYLTQRHIEGLDRMDVISHRIGTQAKDVPFTMKRNAIDAAFDMACLKQWLCDCENGHKHPDRSSYHLALQNLIRTGRFRLIDVENGFLVSPTTATRYLTLSYVWGKSMSYYASTTTPSTYVQHQEKSASLDFTSLPQTIRDAIGIVKAIGERYLWVDGICIAQNDPIDKEANIAAMSSIYGSSVLTIIAGHGADAGAEIPRLRPQSNSAEPIISIVSNGRIVEMMPSKPPLQTALDFPSCAWNSRAWTYQEWLLSFRCVLFTKDEVYFSCPFEERREAYSLVSSRKVAKKATTKSGKPPSLHDAVMGTTTLNFRRYCELVEGYSQRHLTHPGDRLDAFSAILDRFLPRSARKEEAEVAKCGLPLAHMYEALLWTGNPLRPHELRRLEHDLRKTRYFPSWSWIGWTGEIEWSDTVKAKPAARQAALAFETLDSWNIIGLPQPSQRFWKPWPFKPTACPSTERGRATLHLWANVAPVRVFPTPEDKRRFPEEYAVYSFPGPWNASEDSLYLGVVQLSSEYVQEHRTENVLEAIFFSCREDPWDMEIVLTHEVDGFATRVSKWAFWESYDKRWQSILSQKHIKLR